MSMNSFGGAQQQQQQQPHAYAEPVAALSMQQMRQVQLLQSQQAQLAREQQLAAQQQQRRARDQEFESFRRNQQPTSVGIGNQSPAARAQRIPPRSHFDAQASASFPSPSLSLTGAFSRSDATIAQRRDLGGAAANSPFSQLRGASVPRMTGIV
jgi:hypothetical protein